MSGLIIYTLSLGGGAGKNAIKYAEEAANLGYRVTLAYGRDPTRSVHKSASCDYIRVSLSATTNWDAVAPLYRLLQKEKPQAVIAIGASNLLTVLLCKTLARDSWRVILRETNSPSGLLNSYPWRKAIIRRLMLRYSYSKVNAVIALTEDMAREFRGYWKVPDDRVSVVPNGVALDRKYKTPRTRSAEPVLLYVGRLTAQKDVATLLRAFHRVLETRASRLRIAGAGPELARLQDLAKTLGLVERVDFLGHVDDTASLFYGADVLVLTSRYEGFPNVLLESIAHGVPVVSTDCPTGPADVIADGKTGALANVGDPEDVAVKILDVLRREIPPKDLLESLKRFSDDQIRGQIRAVIECSVKGVDGT
ncbi:MULTISPECIES: glycosyltransferase [unclassified Thioalkalivibrio]|uniref:glycosyltransferase n=1 Tax=unclassified Thioalkalivibrio TaxID=2621013 RepID=UPI0009DAE8D2|nr:MULTISPECIES: glycosyltransferase [unclassified Thioalkalivibrio]